MEQDILEKRLCFHLYMSICIRVVLPLPEMSTFLNMSMVVGEFVFIHFESRCLKQVSASLL
jgi:hypothetical protein